MTYYRVLPGTGFYGSGIYKVQVKYWWCPIWITRASSLGSAEKAQEWIKGHSTYYDGAE